MAAERLGSPHITLGIMIRMPGSVLNSFARQEFADLLSFQSIPPDPDLTARPVISTGLHAPSFVSEDWPKPASGHHIGPIPFDKSGRADLPSVTAKLNRASLVAPLMPVLVLIWTRAGREAALDRSAA